MNCTAAENMEPLSRSTKINAFVQRGKAHSAGKRNTYEHACYVTRECSTANETRKKAPNPPGNAQLRMRRGAAGSRAGGAAGPGRPRAGAAPRAGAGPGAARPPAAAAPPAVPPPLAWKRAGSLRLLLRSQPRSPCPAPGRTAEHLPGSRGAAGQGFPSPPRQKAAFYKFYFLGRK